MKRKLGLLLLTATMLISLAACGGRTYYVSPPPAPGAHWVPGHYDYGPYGGRHWVPGHWR